MKTTISLLGTVVILVAMMLGLFMVFGLIDVDIFKEDLGKLLVAAVIVAGGTLALLAINEPVKPVKKAKK